jgi:hypothetical protein
MPPEQGLALVIVLALVALVIYRWTLPARVLRQVGGDSEQLTDHPTFSETVRKEIRELADLNRDLEARAYVPAPAEAVEVVRLRARLDDVDVKSAELSERLRTAAVSLASAARGPRRRESFQGWRRWTWVRNELTRNKRLRSHARQQLRSGELAVADPATSGEALDLALTKAGYDQVEVEVANRGATLNLSAPRDTIPRTIRQTRGGSRNRHTVEVPRRVTDVKRDYISLVALSARKAIGIALAAVPGLREVTLSMFETRVHPLRGHEYEACILSLVADRSTWDSILHEHVSAENALQNFDLRFRWDGRFNLQEVAAFGSLASAPADPFDLNPIEFEELTRALLQKMGLVAKLTRRSGDGGIDIDAESSDPVLGGRILVQCKRYRGSVGEPEIRDLAGALNREHAMKGILITTGSFSRAAIAFAEGVQITLIDGAQLRLLLRRYGLLQSDTASERTENP